jgi:predicted TIM-barrel fold metal-dependent hydrolase
MTLSDSTTARVVDADTHFTEPHDLFVKRAPAAYRDRVPHVESVDGKPTWVVGSGTLGGAWGGSVIDKAGDRYPFKDTFLNWELDEIHEAVYKPKARLALMDKIGVYAQVTFSNSMGVGGQTLVRAVPDAALRQVCIEIYNDAMAEVQAETKARMVPMPVLPTWDVAASVAEAKRIASMDLRGVAMCSDPQDFGAPDLASRAWDPLWEVLEDLGLAVHFHIGASQTASSFLGNYSWPSQHPEAWQAITGSLLILGNARVLVNVTYAGIFDRFPRLKMVSVESGLGWIPFILESMDHEIYASAPEAARQMMQRKPSEYFKTNWLATFWFEHNQHNLPELINKIGEDNVMFETDYPHPTCLYPDPVGYMAEKMAPFSQEVRGKMMGENACKLYRL